MDAANCSLASGLVSQSYVSQGAAALAARRRMVKALLSNRSLPAEGWDEATIEMLLQDAALMDSNTFPGQVGLGEREGRVACPLVARRHGLLAHGIGRSGDITAEQPKAAGSSLLAKLCAALAADALKIAGLQDQGPAVVLPCATGMTLTLVLLAAAGSAAAAAAAAPAAAANAPQPAPVPPLLPPQAVAAAAARGTATGSRPGSVIAVVESVAPTRRESGLAATAAAAAALGAGTLAAQPPPSPPHQPAAAASTAAWQPAGLRAALTAVAPTLSFDSSAAAASNNQQQQQRKQYVVWSRIDQKTCLKSITAANLTPIVIELIQQGDELATNVEGIRAAVQRVGAQCVAAVVTTTSCFAPRACDDVVSVAKLCAAVGVTHVVNNAYGVQSATVMKALTAACRRGRVDAIVQSTDKNFMVPVGGAIISAPAGKGRGWLVDAVAKGYPGRAAMTPLLDLLATLLYWGAAGWREKLQQREELYVYLRDKLSETAVSLGERVLVTPSNPISLAMTLDGLAAAAAAAATPAAAAENGSSCSNGASSGGRAKGSGGQAPSVSFFGSMLWARNVSGTRVLINGKQQTIAGITFHDYGTHCTAYPHPYMNAAAAIGGSKQEVDVFLGRLTKAYRELQDKWQTGAAEHAL